VAAVLRHFVKHQANCVIEVNPANFYVNPPVIWEKRLLEQLVARGCRIGDFRCVWQRSAALEEDESHRIECFGPERIEEYVRLSMEVDPKKQWSELDQAAVAQSGWRHYIGFVEDRPAALGSMFIGQKIAYLSFWYTNPGFRGRGLQQDGIRRRVRDAMAVGCELVFTVTDFNFSSPANLQRCGFSLAYNYLMVRRDPEPL